MGLSISKCLNRKKRSVVFIGAPGSGKDSVIKILRKDKAESDRTDTFEDFTVRGKGYATYVYNVSDDQKHARFWKFYTENCHLVVFVINISEEQKIVEAKEVFENFFTSYGMNKESIVFLLNDPCAVPVNSAESSAALVDDSANTRKMRNSFYAHFSMVSGLDRKVLSKNMVTNSTTRRKKIVSFICKHLS